MITIEHTRVIRGVDGVCYALAMAEILLYGIIGDRADNLDAATLTAAIRGSTGPLSIRINSPGGFVMEGLAIVEAIRSYPDHVTAYIDGLAASMASVVAMVADEIIMAESALMMIHKPQDGTFGDAPELRRCAEQLDRIETQLVGIYAGRTNLPEGELIAMLAAETWFTAEQALAAGFVTAIAPALKIAAMANVSAFGFRHTPVQLKDRTMPPALDSAQAVADERTRVATIMGLGDKHKLPAAMVTALITDGVGLEQARSTTRPISRSTVTPSASGMPSAVLRRSTIRPFGRRPLRMPSIRGSRARRRKGQRWSFAA